MKREAWLRVTPAGNSLQLRSVSPQEHASVSYFKAMHNTLVKFCLNTGTQFFRFVAVDDKHHARAARHGVPPKSADDKTHRLFVAQWHSQSEE